MILKQPFNKHMLIAKHLLWQKRNAFQIHLLALIICSALIQPYQTQYYTPQPNARKVPFQPGYMLTVAEETPIFYQYQGEVNQAKATWIQQLKQNDQLHAQIAADIVTAYEALMVSMSNLIKFQKELLPAALQAAQLSRRGYELGQN